MAHASPVRTGKPRLLVVDDEPDMLDFVERVFRRNYRVERALSVAEALPLLAEGTVAVIITDRRMPHVRGEELLTLAAALQPAAIKLVLTGFSDEEPDAGVDAWLHKPVDAEALKAAVAIALARRAGRT